MKEDRKRKVQKKRGMGTEGRKRRKEKEEDGGRIRKGGGGACTHGLTHFH